VTINIAVFVSRAYIGEEDSKKRVWMTQRSTANSGQILNHKQHFFFLGKRKPVLKEKNNGCLESRIRV